MAAFEHLILTSTPDDSTTAAWNDCLDNSEFAGLFVTPNFLRTLYFKDQRPFAVLAVSDGKVHGVVTGLFADRDIECGHSGSPQICLRTGSNPEAVGEALAAGLRSHALPPTEFISAFAWTEVAGFRSVGFRPRKFEVPLGTIVLDLSKGADVLLQEMSMRRRYNIRHAIKTGVDVEEMNVDRDFDEYYALYRHWSDFKLQDLRPYHVHREVFASGGNRLLLVARHKKRMVGVSTFRFRRPGLMEYTSNVSRREDSNLKQNDLLVWRAIEWSIRQQDIRYFSMTAAHYFLQAFGGRQHTTLRYSLDLTTLRRRDLAESARDAAIALYGALPQQAKRGLKKMFRTTGAAE
jgi:FemAB family